MMMASLLDFTSVAVPVDRTDKIQDFMVDRCNFRDDFDGFSLNAIMQVFGVIWDSFRLFLSR